MPAVKKLKSVLRLHINRNHTLNQDSRFQLQLYKNAGHKYSFGTKLLMAFNERVNMLCTDEKRHKYVGIMHDKEVQLLSGLHQSPL